MMSLPGWKVSNILLGKTRGQLLVAPQRMKWLGQSEINAQLWMCLSGGESKVRCCNKHRNCIGTWNVRFMNQGKLDMIKGEMARVNINILGISEPKWTGMDEFNSDDQLN